MWRRLQILPLRHRPHPSSCLDGLVVLQRLPAALGPHAPAPQLRQPRRQGLGVGEHQPLGRHPACRVSRRQHGVALQVRDDGSRQVSVVPVRWATLENLGVQPPCETPPQRLRGRIQVFGHQLLCLLPRPPRSLGRKAMLRRRWGLALALILRRGALRLIGGLAGLELDVRRLVVAAGGRAVVVLVGQLPELLAPMRSMIYPLDEHVPCVHGVAVAQARPNSVLLPKLRLLAFAPAS
mmetsp:Transcript_36332/g.72318  ORF Transcript_36332/g.72318 Transcript_36332/m.72318 type:complete len:237 (-) Transcript_36332:267-977(-)